MPNSNFGNIQYKASNGLIKLDELEGIVECFVSGIGNKDSVGDICATGAFAKSLQRRKPRVVWGHNWNDPIGKVLEIYEVPASDQRLPMKMKMAGIGGLYAKVQFNLQSEKGREAFANVAFFGEEQEWSIGYKTLRAQYDENLQANVLYEVELYEVSPVLHGANQLTGTISVKSDEEKMHGMMPMSISAPSSEPRRDGLFDEGVSQRISGPQLAGVVAELSRRAAGPVMVVEATENSVVFVKPGKGKFRIGYHFTGSEYMFGKPELIHAEQAKPPVQSGPSPMPGIMGKPNKPSTNNPAMAMPVAMKPINGGMVMVPLAPVEYEGSDKNKKPELGAEESELAESLVRIASKYGKFDEDGDGIWAGYYPPAENKVKDIGVKCSNCVLYQGEGKCKILDFKVEDEAKCRFAIIPDGVVVGYGKKQYSDILDDEEIKMIEDIEAKYPGEFILGTFRNLVKKRRKKRKSYKTLEEWGVEESELEEKGLDPFLANEYSYVIPVNLEDAFEFKSVIDPVLDYHRIDTTVNEYGIVINSPLSEESKDAITRAASSAYEFLKKKVTSEEIEEKALGRRIAGRAIDRPNIGGKRRRGGRGLGMPSGDLDPRTRRDSNLDGTLFDGWPGWEQPDPTPSGPGSIDNPKPSKRQLSDAAKPDGKEKLSSGTRNLRRHADRSAEMEKEFPNAEENQKRIDHEAIAKAWEDQGLGWEEVPRYNADKNFSSDYLRGREIGVNQARVMWDGDSVRKRPEKFNEKQKASQEYSNWYSSYAKSVSAYLDAHSRDDSDNWDGIESALRADVKSKYPDVQDWRKEDIATLNEYLNDIGLLDAGDKKKKLKKVKKGEGSQGGPDLQELRRLNSEGKLSSGDKKKPSPWEKRRPEKPLSPRLQKLQDEMGADKDKPRRREEPKASRPAPPPIPRSATEKPSRPSGPPPIPGVKNPRLSSGRSDKTPELRSWENLNNDEKKGILQATYAWRNRGWDSDWNTGKAKRDRNNQLTLNDNDEFFSDLLEKNPEIHPDYVDPDTGVTHNEIIDVYNDYGKEEVVDAIYGAPTSDDLEDVRLGTDWGLEPVGPYGSEPDVVPSEQDVIDQYYEDMTGNISIDDIKKFIAGEKNQDTDGSRLSSGRKEALNDAMSRDSKPASFDGYGGDIDAEFATGGWDDSGPFSDDYLVDLDTVSSANGTDFIGNTVTLNDGRRGVIVDGSDFDIELRDSEYSSRRDTPTPIAGGIDIVITHDENGNLLDTPEYLNDGYEVSFDTDNGTGFLIADEDMWKKQNDKENEGFTLIQIDDNKVDDDIAYDLAEEKLIAMQPARDAARAKEILSKLDYRGFSDEYKSKLRRELGQIRQRQFANSESRGLSSGRRGGRRGESLYTPGEDPETTIRKDQLWELGEIGHTDMEAERILDHWMDADGEKQDEYINEYGAGGERFSQDVAYAASQMYQDYLETQYDNRQARNLSSGKRKNQEELGVSDREIFERRMGGESLMDTASALGMTREDVRQAEIRHMARERGTLNRPDFDEIESYREDQARMAAEEAEELSMNESIYDRRMGGESLADTAKALGMTREQVRRREQKHIQLLRDRDKEAKNWLATQSGDTLGSGRKKYANPLEGMNPGQRLSSGKLDEVYRSVQEQLIQQIEKVETEGGKWEFPWHRDASLPRNAMNNNRPYSGINSLMLMFQKDAMNYETGLWAGFNQWKEKGGTVRKGEKGTMIIIPTIIPAKKDADGNEIKPGSIFFKTGYVFNLDQIDGIDKEQFKMPQLSEEERVAELEQALSEIGAVVNHGGDRAFYRPSTDEITLPPFSSFKSKEAYYAVFAHELMHWTGGKSRLNRDHMGDFGSPEYAQEELIAEIASAFFMTAHGLTPEPREDHAQYLASWLKKLKSDPDALKNAFEQAQKAHDYAISLSPSMSKKLGRKVAEAGVIPGNRDATYDGAPAALSSGRRSKYVLNPEGTIRTLADEMGAFGDEVLTEFEMRRGYRDGDRNWFEASAFMGGRSRPSQWNVSQDESGEWFAELMVMDGIGEDDEIDWDIAGVGSEGFKSPEDAARWADSYASSRREWQRKFKAETDIEKIAEMLNEEEARQDAEYENYKRASRERADRQEYVRMMAQIDESRLDWSAEDWADEASDIQAELMRENSRLSSGVRSRYDETPAEKIGLVTDALKRTDEAGSNSRHIAANLPAVPVEKYDFDSIRRNGEVISFTYNGKPRMVYPTGMMTKKGGGIYFIGLDEESGQYRSFSLHKIEGLVDGAVAPINPTQPGVPQGTSFSSGRRTRSLVSSRIPGGGRLSSGRSPEDIKSEFEKSGQFNNPVTQDALDGKIGFLPNGGRGRIALEDHKKAIDAIDDLVATRDEYIRAALDGKKITKQSTPSIYDLTGQISDDDMEFIDRLDSAIYDIESQLEDHAENLALLNEQTDDLREKIGLLENSYRNSWRHGGKVDFESAMQKHIDDADGDAADAVDSMRFDAQEIQGVLEDIEAIDDSFIRSSLQSQINEIEDLVDSINNTTKPEDFAAKLSDMYYGAVNRLERELSDLFGIGESFEESGVSLNRESKRGLPEDIFSPSNLSNFDMVEGDVADFLEPGDTPGLSSGRNRRTQGSKRRPMSDADRQAFADGVRQRAATIPGKKRPGPSKDEFGTEKFSSGRLRMPGELQRNKVGRELAADVKIKFGKTSENNDRSPDGKWMLDARKLQQILKDENGKPLSKEQIADYLGISEIEAEKMFKEGAGISEADAYALIDRAFSDSSNPFQTSDIIDGIWGFGAKPYWYDKDGNQLTREQYDDFLDEGIYMAGLMSPADMVETEQTVAQEISKGGFSVSALSDSLGVESDAELSEALTFEVDGVTFTPTPIQLKKWKQEGVPTGIVEQLVNQGIIPSAGEVFGEDGTKFDNSIPQFSLWRNVVDAVERSGKKVKWDDIDEVLGAAKVISRLKTFEQGKQPKFSPRVGKALRYSDEEVQEIVDRLNKKYDLSETVDSVKGGGSLSSGRRAARRISNSGQEAVEKLSSGRKNNGAPENITPRMQNELIGWAENARWSGFAQSIVSQFKANGFLSSTQWTRLLQLHDNSQKRR